MNTNKTIALIVLSLSVFILLSGCASPVSKDAVIAHNVPIAQQYQKTVSVKTQGGNETGAMDSSNISNSDLAQAIEESIVDSKLFTRVVHGADSDYLLSVTIINMTKPVFGASFTVSMEAAWSLIDQKTKKVAMRESIKSSYTATMGQAFVGVTRLRLAVEGAVRENIRLGLMKISNLQFNLEK